jgi:hypothetical protein
VNVSKKVSENDVLRQIVKCKNSWGKWEETSVIKIDELDGVPYKWYCANGASTYRPDQDFSWKGKPRAKSPPAYIPRSWVKGEKVKYYPYATLSFKPITGVIEEDLGDGFVLIKMNSGKKDKIPEVNIFQKI